MKDRLEQKKQTRLIVLQQLYELVDGNDRASYTTSAFYKKLSERGISTNDAQEAFGWLHSHGLAKPLTQGTVAITHDGVCEIESAYEKPDDATEHFPASVINNVFNIGSVGGIQTGSHNKMNVAQQVNGVSGQDLATLFAQLRGGIAELPKEQREEAEVIAGELEKQAASDKPSKALVKSYASTLNDYLIAYAPVIVAIVDWCAKKWGS